MSILVADISGGNIPPEVLAEQWRIIRQKIQWQNTHGPVADFNLHISVADKFRHYKLFSKKIYEYYKKLILIRHQFSSGLFSATVYELNQAHLDFYAFHSLHYCVKFSPSLFSPLQLHRRRSHVQLHRRFRRSSSVAVATR